MNEPACLRVSDRESLRIPGYPVMEISAACGQREPVDVTIEVDAVPISTVKQFAGRAAYDSATGTFPANIEYFAGTLPRPFLFLIGLFEIWFISPSLDATRVVRLKRSSAEDPGFFALWIHAYDSFFLVRYESGVCRLAYDGRVEWHISLKWDDIFLREALNSLVYSNEHLEDGKEWRIRIDNGEIVAG